MIFKSIPYDIVEKERKKISDLCALILSHLYDKRTMEEDLEKSRTRDNAEEGEEEDAIGDPSTGDVIMEAAKLKLGAQESVLDKYSLKDYLALLNVEEKSVADYALEYVHRASFDASFQRYLHSHKVIEV